MSTRSSFRAVAVVTAVLVAWLVAETSLRAFGQPVVTELLGDPIGTPNGSLVYRGGIGGAPQPANVVKFNSLGCFDREPGPKQGRRVLVLGDSFVEAVQIPLEQHMHRVLGRLKNVDTVAIALSGWGQRQEFDALERYAPKLQPDETVLVFTTENDVRNNAPWLEYDLQELGTPWLRLQDAGLLVPAAIFKCFDRRGGFDEGARNPSTPEWLEAWKWTLHYCDKIACKTPLRVIATSSSPILETWCRSRSIPFAVADGPRIEGDGHWSRDGHELAALLAARLCGDS